MRSRAPLILLLALVLVSETGCGESATPPVAPPAPVEPPPETSDATGLAGVWYVFLHEMPWVALRVQVLATPAGPSVSWISFDWSGSADAEHLSSASKPVSVSLQGQLPAVVLDGPAPMLSADGQPNGQRGSLHLELHAPSGNSRHLVGTASSEQLTPASGTPAEMSREWRGWKRP
jgi:hypothetical protein